MNKQNSLSPRARRNLRVTQTELAPKGEKVHLPKRKNITHVQLRRVSDASTPHDLCDALKEAIELSYPGRVCHIRITQSRGWYRAYASAMFGACAVIWRPVNSKGNKSRAIRRDEMVRHIEALQASVRVGADITEGLTLQRS